jgi:hypothetical protein
MDKTATIGVLLLVIVGVGIYLVSRSGDPAVPGPRERMVVGWELYRSEQFSFAIEHPPAWQVSEHLQAEITPMFNIRPPGPDPERPLDHHADATHLSIYPEGIPTEGVFGERAPTQMPVNDQVAEGWDYLLEDGTIWGTMLTFHHPPESWTESGFVWAAAAIQNLEVQCFRNDKQVGEAECDPLMGDRVVRRGEVDREERSVVEQMLATFRFTDDPRR